MKRTPLLIGFIAASSFIGGVAYNTNMNKEEPKEVRQAEVKAEDEVITLDNGITIPKADFESERLTRTRVKYFLEIREKNPNMDEVAIWYKVNEKYPDPTFDPLNN